MQYMDQIDILREFIKSEQVGNWVMQVQTIKAMPPNLQGGGDNRTKYICSSRLLMDDKSTASHLASVKSCMRWNQWSSTVQQLKSDQHKDCSAAQRQKNRHDSNNILEYLGSGKNIWGKLCHSTFSWYWHCCTWIRECWHAAKLGHSLKLRYSLKNDWSQRFRFRDQEELPCYDACAKLPCQGHIRYSLLLGRDVLKYELRVYHPALYEAPCCNPTNHLKPMPSRWVSCTDVTLDPE